MNPSSPFPLPNWKIPAGRALETALNQALALDDETRAALPALDGRTVVLRVAAPALALQVRVDGDVLRVGPAPEDAAADLSVRGTLGGLLGQLPMFRREGAKPGALRIEGDADVARRLQSLAQGFSPDWGKPFAAVFGDVIGVQVANAVAFALHSARHGAQELAQSAANYVTEESRDVVGKAELAAFNDDVDVLRDDVERMAARIERLAGRAG